MLKTQKNKPLLKYNTFQLHPVINRGQNNTLLKTV